MPLYIRDETVDDLAIRYQKVTGAASKTAAVRNALIEGLKQYQNVPPLKERIAELQIQADEIGPVDPGFSMKKFSDDLWEGQ